MSHDCKLILLLLCGLLFSGCCWANSLHWAAMEQDTQGVEDALQEGVPVNERECDGLTPLWIAASTGNETIVRMLLEAGAQVDARSGAYRQITPLIVAAAKGYTGTVRILLEAGADVNAQSSSGETALMEAAIEGHFGIARLLLQAGANVNLQNRENKTAATLAKENGWFAIARLIMMVGERRASLSYERSRRAGRP